MAKGVSRFGRCINCGNNGILQSGIYYEGNEKRVGVVLCDLHTGKNAKTSLEANLAAIKAVGLPVDVVQGKARDITEDA